MPKENNFDLLRLVLAWMVVFYHAAVLSAMSQLAWIPKLCSGEVAVEGFFAISGCLITMSYDRDNKLKSYITRRARRILPGYYFATVFVLVLGAVMTRENIWRFLAAPGTLQFLCGNLGLYEHFHPSLPGLFTANPNTSAVNGALWTIKVEVMFYAFVPIFFWLCRRLGAVQVVAGLFVSSLFYRALFVRLGMHHYAEQLPGQLSFFMVGAATYFNYAWFRRHRSWMWILATAAILLYLLSNAFVLRAIGVSLMTMNAGLLLPKLSGLTRYGDFSYGTYVLHFPVTQTLVSLGLFAFSPWLGVAACAALVLPLSVLSWNLVEKRFLRRVRMTRPAPGAPVFS